MAASRTDPLPSRRCQSRLETVSRACALLLAFADEEETLSLAAIARRTGFEKTIAFRLVHTLEEAGFLRKVQGRLYSTNVRLRGKERFRLGFAAQAEDSQFSCAVTNGLRRAAARAQLQLLVLDNHYSASQGLRNAERLVAEHVDLALEFQTYESVAPAISSLFQSAGIPLIAVEIPHPGAVYYGVDNYKVGMKAGETLARWAKRHWAGQVDEALLLELKVAGAVPHLRLAGAEAVLRRLLPEIGQIRHLDARGEFECSLDCVRKHLRQTGARRSLIVGVNDPMVLGALRAFEEAGRLDFCVAVGLGAIPAARAELRRPASRLIGSVAFYPEVYGTDLVSLALDILYKRHVPPAVYAPHRMISRENVNRFYFNDDLEAHWTQQSLR